MAMSIVLPAAIPNIHVPVVRQIAALLVEQGVSGWLVGGYVRDLLRGAPGHDLDIAVDGPALELARTLANRTGGAFVTLDSATDSARIVWKVEHESDAERLVVDLVGLRAPTIDQDLLLRDFTINALAVPLAQLQSPIITAEKLLDPVGGQSDLRARLVRQAGPGVLHDDPLRMLRAVRCASQFGFTIEPATDRTIRALASSIDLVAHERVRDELLKLLASRHAAPWLNYMDDVGLLTRILPELEPARDCAQPAQHFLPVLGHLLESVAAWEWLFSNLQGIPSIHIVGQEATAPALRVPMAVGQFPQLSAPLPNANDLVQHMQQPMGNGQRRSTYFKLATVLHDVGKPATKGSKPDGRITFYDHPEVGAQMVGQIAQRLRLGREAGSYLQLLVREHMRPGQLRALGPELTRRALYRLLRDTGAAARDVLLHSLCDHLAARGPHLDLADWAHHVAWTTAVLTEDWVAHPNQPPSRLVTGTDVIKHAGIAPGPLVGKVLAEVAEAQFLGEVRSKEEALALAINIARSASQKPNNEL